MTVNPADPTPAYLQIANYLRSRIQRGELRDGDRLPSQRELIEISGSAPGTVQRALSQLETEGIVITRHGRGTFVRQPVRITRDGSTRHIASTRSPGASPMYEEAWAQVFSQGQQVLGAGLTAAPLMIAELLRVREGELLLARRFLLTLNDEPAQMAVSYFAPSLADDPVLQTPEKVPGGTHEYLRNELGLDVTYAIEDLIARMPIPEEAQVLRLAPGTPVVELVRTIYTANGTPVEVTLFFCAADRYRFRYRVPMK